MDWRVAHKRALVWRGGNVKGAGTDNARIVTGGFNPRFIGWVHCRVEGILEQPSKDNDEEQEGGGVVEGSLASINRRLWILCVCWRRKPTDSPIAQRAALGRGDDSTRPVTVDDERCGLVAFDGKCSKSMVRRTVC